MPLLQIDGLTHSFGGLMAVAGFNTALYENETVGLIGPNGAGKTTIFNLLCGLYRPQTGDLRFDGKRLNDLRPHQITSLGIGRTFQNIRLWNELSVLDNLRIAHYSQMNYGFLDTFFLSSRLRAAERRVHAEALELLQLFGLEQYSAERPRNLAYGAQRRVEICRALVMKPKLLLLDEPAAGMNQGEMDRICAHHRRGAHHHAQVVRALVGRPAADAGSDAGFVFPRRSQLDFLRRQAAYHWQPGGRKRQGLAGQAGYVAALTR